MSSLTRTTLYTFVQCDVSCTLTGALKKQNLRRVGVIIYLEYHIDCPTGTELHRRHWGAAGRGGGGGRPGASARGARHADGSANDRAPALRGMRMGI